MNKLFLSTCVMACAALAHAADDIPYLADDLQIWFRADKGVTTNESGVVTGWKNQGKLGTAADVALVGTAGVTLNPTGLGGQAAVVFDGSSNSACLRSANAVNYGATTDGAAWFVVFQTSQAMNDRVNTGIFGSTGGDSGNPRFGAFFANPQNTDNGKIVNGFVYSDNATPTANSVGMNAVSLCCSAWKEGTTCHQYSAVNWTSGKLDTKITSTAIVSNGKFHIGHLHSSSTWIKPFVGQIAEVRVYKRPLTRRERIRIQMEMHAHYGLAWESNGFVEQAALQQYANSSLLEGITNEGVPEGTVAAESTGGLDLTLTTPSAMDAANGYLTHDGRFGLARRWFLSTWGKPRTGSDLSLSFDVPASFAADKLALLHRANTASGWRKLDVTGTYANNRLVYLLPKGTWANGWYRLGYAALAAWFRADSGVVTNAAGHVESWQNIGAHDRNIDLAPVGEAGASVVVGADAANGCPAAQFDGGDFLRSANTCELGVTYPKSATSSDRYLGGAAWFVVFKPGVAGAERNNMAPFSLPHTTDPSKFRCGTFFPSGTGKVLNLYLYDESDTNPLTVNAADGWQIVSYARWTRASDLYAKGQVFSNGTSGSIGWPKRNPWGAYLQLGNLGLSWAKNFKGDIAELRFYNETLNAADRAKVEIALAVRYGISVKTAGIDGVPPADWQEDAQVFNGKFSEYNGVAATNAVSGELTLTCTEPTDQKPEHMTFFAHNAAPMYAGGAPEGFSARSWFVSSGAPDKAYRFAFAGLDALQGKVVRLWYRPNAQSAWQRVASADQGAFDLPSLPRGYYTVEVTSKGLGVYVK